MTFTNRLIRPLPNVGDRGTQEVEQSVEAGVNLDADVEKQEGSPGYAITSDTFDYYRLNSLIPISANTRIEKKRPEPTQSDYDKGWFMRYFVKRYDKLPVEVDKPTLGIFKEKSADSPGLYSTGAIKWHLNVKKLDLLLDLTNDSILMKLKSIEVGAISGDISKINERYTMISDKACPGILKVIDGMYTEYTVSKPGDTVKNNLYTAGKEYKKPNGQNYIGYYHIHNRLGPMVGKTHIPEKHDKLLPTQSRKTSNSKATNSTPSIQGNTSSNTSSY